MQRLIDKAFNLAVLEKSRMHWVDYLKGIAIILVVYRHVLIGIERSGIEIPQALVNANMIFYSFRMPLFFILSGIFINRSLAKRALQQFAFIKFDNLLYPYFVWTILQVTLQIIFSHFTNAHRSFVDYSYILYQPRNLDQFWYLPALFNTTIIYMLVKAKLKAPAWMQLLLGVVFYFLSSQIHNISMLSDWMEFYIFFALGDAVSTLFFRSSFQNSLKKNILFFLMLPVFILVQLYYLSNGELYYLVNTQGKIEFLLIALIGCVSMLILAFRLQSLGIFSFLRVIGYHSLYIYVMHVFAAALIRIFLTTVLGIYNPFVLLILCICFGLITPIVFYNFLIKDNILWFLFSTKRKGKESVPAEKIKPGTIITQ